MNSPKYNKMKKDKEKKHNDLEIYIGKNYNIITEQIISLNALLFGPFYTLYRKIYSKSIILILIYLVTGIYLNSNIYIFLNITINFILALYFRKMYINYAKNKINKIRKNYSEKKENEIIQIIKKTGGTLPIHYLITVIIIFIGTITIVTNKELLNKKKTEKSINKNNIENIEYILPNNTTIKENLKNYQYYINKNNDITCFIMISTNYATKYKNENDYLIEKKNSYEFYNNKVISTENINNTKWTVLKLDNKKEEYVIKYKDTIYEFSFENKNNNSCNESKNIILNSIKKN